MLLLADFRIFLLIADLCVLPLAHLCVLLLDHLCVLPLADLYVLLLADFHVLLLLLASCCLNPFGPCVSDMADDYMVWVSNPTT